SQRDWPGGEAPGANHAPGTTTRRNRSGTVRASEGRATGVARRKQAGAEVALRRRLRRHLVDGPLAEAQEAAGPAVPHRQDLGDDGDGDLLGTFGADVQADGAVQA